MEHLARNCSQKKKDDPSLVSGDKDVVTGSEAFFSSIVCHDYNDEAVFAYNPNVSSRDGESVPCLGLDSRVVCPHKSRSQQGSCVEVDHREFLVYADHFLFGPSVHFPGVENSMEVDTAEHLPSGPSVDFPDAKRQMEINISNGVSVRAVYKAMRKRVRIEARRQKELEEGRPPEVPLESFSSC